MDVVTIVDDLDGRKGAERITFSLDGQDLEIDLAPANKKKFERIFADIIPHARRAGVARRPGAAATTGEKPRTAQYRRERAACRAWCIANGITVAERGRIPVEAQDRYRAAMKASRSNGKAPAAPPLVLQEA